MKPINFTSKVNNKLAFFIFIVMLFLFLAAKNSYSNNISNTNNLSSEEIVQANSENSSQLSISNNSLFSFSLQNNDYVRFSIYNVYGQEIAVLIDDYKKIGEFGAELKSANLKPGIYYYRLVVGKYKEVRRLEIIS